MHLLKGKNGVEISSQELTKEQPGIFERELNEISRNENENNRG